MLLFASIAGDFVIISPKLIFHFGVVCTSDLLISKPYSVPVWLVNINFLSPEITADVLIGASHIILHTFLPVL